MQWPQYTPSRHFLKLDYKKNDTDQKTYTPYVFHMPTEDVPGSFSRYKGNSSKSKASPFIPSLDTVMVSHTLYKVWS